MLKRILPAVMLAASISFAAAPAAEAGPLRDAAKKVLTAGKQAVGLTLLKASCAVDRLRGKGGGFLCGGPLFKK